MLSQLLKLYPDAILNPTPSQLKQESHFIFSLDNQIIALPNDSLSEQEKNLLTLFNHHQSRQPISFQGNQTWYQFLLGKTTQLPTKKINLRFIYLQIKSHESDSQISLWMTTLQEAFPPAHTWFQADEDLFCLVINNHNLDTSLIKSIEGLCQSLDSDFDTRTKFVVGLLHPLNHDLPIYFREEFTYVQSHINHLTSLATAFSSLLLQYQEVFTREGLVLLNPLKDLLSQHTEYRVVIEGLFDTYGNLSQTADKLYIHRNTLSYRIQKFYKETGFDLHYLPDLVICFLSLARYK